jgi:hypothetical protein
VWGGCSSDNFLDMNQLNASGCFRTSLQAVIIGNRKHAASLLPLHHL